MLASRELQTELGWKWEPFRRDVPGMEAGNNVPEDDIPRLLLAEFDQLVELFVKSMHVWFLVGRSQEFGTRNWNPA